MTATITKTDELAAVRQLAEHLGPESYLGPWLAGALPMLQDYLRSDIAPPEADRLLGQSQRDAEAIRHRAAEQAKQIRDTAAELADSLIASAKADAERIRGRVWQQLHQLQKELER